MSTPDDPDLYAELDAALDQLGIDDPAVRAAVAESVRAALAGMGSGGDSSPVVEVVEGGRSDDSPPSANRPPLRVAEPGEREDEGPRLRVVRVGGRAGPEGVIRITPEEDTAWQPIFHGEAPHPYRVHCDTGALRVAVDGVAIGRLQPGQSVDVVGRQIRVGAEITSHGRYTRL